MGESNGEAKRRIRVGFLRPTPEIFRVERDDTIYVRLEPWGESGIGAKAFSTKDFKYDGRKVEGESLLIDEAKTVSNETFTERGGLQICRPPYDEFIRKLSEENNAIIEAYYLRDGIELYKKLREIRRIVGRV